MILDSMGNVDIGQWGHCCLDPIYYASVLRVTPGGAAATATPLPGNAFGTRVAVDGAGNIYAVWTAVMAQSQFSSIEFSRSTDGGATFSDPLVLSTKGSDPNLALDAAGHIFVVWSDGVISLSRSVDQGNGFSAPVPLSDPSRNAGTPEIAVASDGTVAVFWESVSPALSQCDIWFSRSTDSAQTFSSATNISNSTGCAGLGNNSADSAYDHQFQIDSQNNIDIVWNDRVQGVMFSRSPDTGGHFLAPENISPGQGYQPKMAVDSAGNINLVWDQAQGTSAGGFLFSRSTDAGSNFSMPAILESPQPGTSSYQLPAIATDAAGDIDLVWQDGNYLRFAQSFDGGQTFSSAITINTSFDQWGAQSGPADVIAEPSGDVDVTWTATYRGDDYDYPWFSRGVASSTAPPAPLTFTVAGAVCCASGSVGNTFIAYLTSQGGTPPYSTTVSGLPPGLFADSPAGAATRILGTPTTAGTFTVGLLLRDAAGVSVASTLDVTISNATNGSGYFNIGNLSAGEQTDSGDSSRITTSRLMTGAVGGSLTEVDVYIASPVDPAPNNQFSVALYRDNAGVPGTLMAVSDPQPIVPDSWNKVYFDTSVLPNTAYWLAYQTNGTSLSSNNVRFTAAGQSAWLDHEAFDQWPATFHPGGQSARTIAAFFTMDAYFASTYDGGGSGNLAVGYDQTYDFDEPYRGFSFYTDSGDSNRVTITRLGNAPATYYQGTTVMPANGEAVAVGVFLAPGSSPAPNNQFQIVLYSDDNGSPGALIAATSTALNSGAGGWITVPLFTAIQAGQAYWLAYNTNGTSASLNDIRIMNPVPSSTDGKANFTEWVPAQFGTWPATISPTGTASGVVSIYLNYIPNATPPQ
jgi:hypothetical protein